MEDIYRKIKKFRENLNYSQEYIADQLGISQPAYAKMENGITRITLKRFHKILTILEVEPWEFWKNNPIQKDPGNDCPCHLTEKLYKDNKSVYEGLIEQLTGENARLITENERLRNLVHPNLKTNSIPG